MNPVKLFMVPAEKFVKVDFCVTVRNAVEVMRDHGIGSVFVTREGSLIGILSDTEVVRRLVATGMDPSQITVEQIMTAPITMIDENKDLLDANNLIAREQIRHLGVARDGKLVGMISVQDVLVGLTTGPSSAIPPSWAGYQEGVRAYERGDYETAVKKFRLLAEQGVARAQYSLGDMYHQGLGVPQNNVQAFMWLILSAMAGIESAVTIQKQLMQAMLPAQIMEAERLAKEWQPQGK